MGPAGIIVFRSHANLLQIVIGGVVNAHIAVKFIYVRMFRGTNSMHTRSFRARGTWAAICAALWVLSWVIAEAIPVFNDVLALAVGIVQKVFDSRRRLTVRPELSFCKLVLLWPSRTVLALYEPTVLVPHLEAENILWHQSSPGTLRVSDRE